jgi:hypothetical protein
VIAQLGIMKPIQNAKSALLSVKVVLLIFVMNIQYYSLFWLLERQ